MAPTSKGLAFLGLLTPTSGLNFNFGSFGPNEKVQIFDRSLRADTKVQAALWSLNEEASLSSLVQFDSCRVVKQRFFENSDELLPLTAAGYHYIECDTDSNRYSHDTTYGLALSLNSGDVEFHRDVKIMFDSNQQPRSRYESSHDQPLQNARKSPMVRSDSPTIEGVIPNGASPQGGALMTVYGQNLRSKLIDLAGQQSESESEGQDYKIWWERNEHRFDCNFDRMNTLHGQGISGKDWIICETSEAPIYSSYKVNLQIDGGDIIKSGWIDFKSGNAPTVDYFYPGNAAPAVPNGAFDYEGEFWTKWFDVDDNSDGVEDESFNVHYNADRSAFQHCDNPIDIEVFDLGTLKLFKNSANENADGRAHADYMSTTQGFKCSNSAQTVNPKTGTVSIMCPNTKVRYRCVPGIVELKGRMFTAVHGRSDDPKFHANRIHESPKVVNENDGWKAEAAIHLNDGQNCGDHANCGRNKRLNLELVDGNDGLMNFKTKANIPGAYNFTYETTHQGKAIVDKRYNNYMTNSDLYPVNFEVYPEIKSVSPQVGSLTGGTILTISGSGFIADGLGGEVSVAVGDSDCEILSMTETEITCRTTAGTQDGPMFGDDRVFTPKNGFSNSNTKYTFSSDQVSSTAECMDLCAKDHTCVGYVYKNGLGCGLIDFNGAADEDIHIPDNWVADADFEGGYIAWNDRADETTCFTGRGEKYVGNAATTDRGEACMAGTFCRNPTPDKDDKPYCLQAVDGAKVYCNLIGCGQEEPKYSGNRGVSVARSIDYIDNVGNLQYQSEAAYSTDKWTVPMFLVSSNKHKYFYDPESHIENSMLVARTFFIAPYDGYFSFKLGSSKFGRLVLDIDSDGSFNNQVKISDACAIDNVDCRSYESVTTPKMFTKGEKSYIWAYMSDDGGDNRLTLGVNYHGVELDDAIWQDKVLKEDVKEDNYAYDIQRLWFDATGSEHHIWLTMNVDKVALDEGQGIGEGETFDQRGGLQFRIQQCGDNNQCFETPELDSKNWRDADVEDYVVENWLTTECQHDGLMNPQHYYAGYETDEAWPHSANFVAGQHGICGRKSHEVHNHDIWNTNLGAKFSTSDMDDICFAYIGQIDEIQVYGKYLKNNGKEMHDWLIAPVGLSSTTWTHTCLSIADELDVSYGNMRDTSQGYYEIANIKLWNQKSSNIYVDELRIGKMRQQVTITQTKKALSFDGFTPSKIDFYFSSSRWWGAIVRMYYRGWAADAPCGFNVPLPKLVPSANVDASLSSEWTSGDDWTGLFTGPYETFEQDNLHPVGKTVSKDYLNMQYNYLRSDNTRHIADTWVVRASEVNDEWDVDVKLTLEGHDGEFNFNMNKDVWGQDIEDGMISTWPFLGNGQDSDLQLHVHRGGWCNDGYNFYIRTWQHGVMPKINVEYTLNSNHFNPEVFTHRDIQTGVHTSFMPGSVTATAHHKPQVVVTANGQRSACFDNCDFSWKSAFTMTFDNLLVNSAQLVKGDEITVTFDVKAYTGTLDDIEVYVSGAISICNPNSITGGGSVKTLTCQVGNIPISTGHTVEIVIPQLGSASKTVEGLVSVSTVTSNDPTAGSQNGGTVVIVQGSGFTAGETVSVTLGGLAVDCDSTGFEVTYDTLTCSTQPNANLPGGRTPVINSISVTEFNVVGGEEFTISGDKFDKQPTCTDNGYVMVGDNKAEIVSWAEKKIVARSPATTTPGQSDVFVYVCNKGYSNTVSASTVLEINSVNGGYSSLMGGKLISIAGSGFASSSDVDSTLTVSLGHIPCEVTESDNNNIVCKTGEFCNNVVKIQAKARSFVDENGNDANVITVEQGQVIEWSWQISLSGVTPQIQIQEVATKGDATGSTMWSELVVGNSGTFRKQMRGKGTYHYSTGLIDGATTFASGTIVVVDAVDKPLKVNVALNGVEAVHTGSSFPSQPAVQDCVFAKATQTASDPADGHYVIYSWGATPVLDRFKVMDTAATGFNEARYPATSQIRVWLNNVNGLTASACVEPARITVGDYSCVVTDQLAYFACSLFGTGMDVNQKYPISVEIPGMGRALFDNQVSVAEDQGFSYESTADLIEFASFVSNIVPSKISRFGGALVTLTGSGFVEPSVYFQANGAGARFPCDIVSFDFFTIVCKVAKITTSANTADQTLIGTVVVGGTSFTIDADLTSLEANTPTVTNISPTTISAAGTKVTIDGSKLTDLDVMIGGQTCEVVSTKSTQVKCTMPDLPSGKYDIKLQGKFGFVVMDPTKIQVSTGVASVQPSTSGLNGGALVTVTGFGFDDDVVVSVRNVDGYLLCEFCTKLEVSSTQIVFSTPRSDLAGDASITVAHEYLTTSFGPFTLSYTDSSSTVAGGSLSNLIGGESVSIEGSFNDCGSTFVQVERVSDPCAVGAHTCHHRAECTPTADGLSYTCSCNTDPNDGSAGYGDGHECYWFWKRTGPDSGYDGLEGYCESAEGSKATTFEIDSVAKEEAFKQWLIATENFNQRGTFVKYYGKWACVRNENVDDEHVFTVFGENSEDCAASGSESKRVHCERGLQGRRNCADDAFSGGRGTGKGDYYGRTGQTLSGLKCMNWEDTPVYDDYKHSYLSNSANWCRNTWDNPDGPFCYLEQRNHNGDFIQAPCGIPKCSELTDDNSRETCLIQPMGLVDPRPHTG